MDMVCPIDDDEGEVRVVLLHHVDSLLSAVGVLVGGGDRGLQDQVRTRDGFRKCPDCFLKKIQYNVTTKNNMSITNCLKNCVNLYFLLTIKSHF